MRRLPKFVNGYTDATGKPRFYLRRRGQRLVALPGMPWSPEFMAAHAQALTGSRDPVANRIKPGTVAGLVHLYLGSTTFTALAADTQRSRRGKRKRKLVDSHGIHSFRLRKLLPPLSGRCWRENRRGRGSRPRARRRFDVRVRLCK